MKRGAVNQQNVHARVEFGLRLLTALLITIAVGVVLLELNVRYGIDGLDMLTLLSLIA
jgi:hypothetical protein